MTSGSRGVHGFTFCGKKGQFGQCSPEGGNSRGAGAGTLTELIEEECILVLLHVLCGPGLVQEERIDPLDVIYLYLCAL